MATKITYAVQGISSRVWRSSKQIAFVVVAIALVALSPVYVQQASAGTPCPNNYVCMYEHINRGGAQINNHLPTIGQCYNMTSAWNDRISSIETSIWGPTPGLTFFASSNCNGASIFYSMGGTDYVASLPWYINDSISSYCRGC